MAFSMRGDGLFNLGGAAGIADMVQGSLLGSDITLGDVPWSSSMRRAFGGCLGTRRR